MRSDIHYHMPSNEGPAGLDKIEQLRELELARRMIVFAAGNMYNTGDASVILASSADGTGNVDVQTSHDHTSVAERLAENLDKTLFKRVVVVPDATKEHLSVVVQSKGVANIFVVGHGTYHSWMATDGTVDWYDAGKMAKDHVKNGIFANLGCGAIRSFNYIPLGRYVVGPKGTLLGKKKELTYLSEVPNLSNFQQIS